MQPSPTATFGTTFTIIVPTDGGKYTFPFGTTSMTAEVKIKMAGIASLSCIVTELPGGAAHPVPAVATPNIQSYQFTIPLGILPLGEPANNNRKFEVTALDSGGGTVEIDSSRFKAWIIGSGSDDMQPPPPPMMETAAGKAKANGENPIPVEVVAAPSGTQAAARFEIQALRHSSDPADYAVWYGGPIALAERPGESGFWQLSRDASQGWSLILGCGSDQLVIYRHLAASTSRFPLQLKLDQAMLAGWPNEVTVTPA